MSNWTLVFGKFIVYLFILFFFLNSYRIENMFSMDIFKLI